MIAAVKEQGRVEFEQLLPGIKKQASVAFRDVPISEREERVAETVATGETTSAAARKFRLSRGRISQLRRELMGAWLEFQGELAVASRDSGR